MTTGRPGPPVLQTRTGGDAVHAAVVRRLLASDLVLHKWQPRIGTGPGAHALARPAWRSRLAATCPGAFGGLGLDSYKLLCEGALKSDFPTKPPRRKHGRTMKRADNLSAIGGGYLLRIVNCRLRAAKGKSGTVVLDLPVMQPRLTRRCSLLVLRCNQFSQCTHGKDSSSSYRRHHRSIHIRSIRSPSVDRNFEFLGAKCAASGNLILFSSGVSASRKAHFFGDTADCIAVSPLPPSPRFDRRGNRVGGREVEPPRLAINVVHVGKPLRAMIFSSHGAVATPCFAGAVLLMYFLALRVEGAHTVPPVNQAYAVQVEPWCNNSIRIRVRPPVSTRLVILLLPEDNDAPGKQHCRPSFRHCALIFHRSTTAAAVGVPDDWLAVLFDEARRPPVLPLAAVQVG